MNYTDFLNVDESEENKKYKILFDNFIEIDTVRNSLPAKIKLYRIQAIRDFEDVKAGDIGGYVENENNLDNIYNDNGSIHTAWIYNKAKVFEKAFVCGYCKIMNYSEISGNALVGGHVRISGHTKIYGQPFIFDHAQVGEHATICGRAWLSGHSKVDGSATVKDKAHVGSRLHVTDNAVLGGSYSTPVRCRDTIGGNIRLGFDNEEIQESPLDNESENKTLLSEESQLPE